MTKEELAEEYADRTETKDWEGFDITREVRKQAFLAGLKAGRPQWHDLRKDPNDLPNEYKIVLNQAGMETQYDPNRGFLGLDGIEVIAWCERPTFDKE